MKIHTLELGRLRSNEHFQFITDVSALVGGLPAASAVRVKAQIDAFAAGVAEEDAVLKKITKSALTARIHDADTARDGVFRGLADAVRSASNHFRAEIRDAAGRVGIVFDTYGNLAQKSAEEETSAVHNLLGDLTGAKYAADAEALGLMPWIGELDRLNGAVAELLRGRDAEVADRPAEAMRDVRRRVDEAYRALTLCVEALSMMEPGADAAGLEGVIERLNAAVDRYDARIAARRGRAAAEKAREEAGGTADTTDN